MDPPAPGPSTRFLDFPFGFNHDPAEGCSMKQLQLARRTVTGPAYRALVGRIHARFGYDTLDASVLADDVLWGTVAEAELFEELAAREAEGEAPRLVVLP